MIAVPVSAAPIQLTRYHLVEQILQLHPDADLEAPTEGVLMNIGVERAVAEGRWLLTVLISINEHPPEAQEGEAPEPINLHHRGRIVLQGEFDWIGSDELPEGEQRDLVTVNGLSVLYGIGRVYARQLSEPFPVAPLLLPTLSFRDAPEALAAVE